MKGSEHFERACDHARKFAEVSATNAELVEAISALEELLYGAALRIKGDLTPEARALLGRILNKIIPLAEHASDGEPTALAALHAIDSLVTPNLLNISLRTLKELGNRAYKGWFARANFLVELMSDLSWVVEPTRGDVMAMRTGPVRPLVSLSEEVRREARLWGDEEFETLHALAVQHCRKNTTLQALAIKVFNALAERDEWESKDERVLKRDLQRFKNWIDEHPTEAPASAYLCLRNKEVTDE
jgi:hypothetical protein